MLVKDDDGPDGTFPNPANIVWVMAGYLDIGTTAHFEGICLVKTKAVFKTGSSLNGRILTQTVNPQPLSLLPKPLTRNPAPWRPRPPPLSPSPLLSRGTPLPTTTPVTPLPTTTPVTPLPTTIPVPRYNLNPINPKPYTLDREEINSKHSTLTPPPKFLHPKSYTLD